MSKTTKLRKSLRIEQITTRADGTIVLEGEGVAIEIKRVCKAYSVANKMPILIAKDGDHTSPLSEFFRGNGSVAF